MRERPILFSGPMVRAILDGRKTQTRRVVKLREPGSAVAESQLYHPHEILFKTAEGPEVVRVPWGPGDLLWVKEAIERDGAWSNYCSDGTPTLADAWPWKRDRLPGMFCPRGLSRITLAVTGVRLERLQAIGEEDAWAEGVDHPRPGDVFTPGRAALNAFEDLWDGINGKRAPWSSNPWVWVVEFRRLEASFNHGPTGGPPTRTSSEGFTVDET